jgi:hypothetical protein
MKYDTLKAHLQKQTSAKVRMSFAEVANAAKVKLPASAYRYPSWWANDPAHHAQARAWTEAGYRTENVDVQGQRVEFVRAERSAGRSTPAKKHPLAGAMKGTFTVRDWDVTQAALDPDELAEWEANIERTADEAYAQPSDKEQKGAKRPGVREMQKTYDHQPGPPYKVHPAYGALKGTFTIDPDWDLTNPVFDEDEMAEWEASLERKAKLIAEGLRRKK